MIKNSRQYEYSKKKLCEFKKQLEAIREKYSSNKSKIALLSQGYKEHVIQLKNEIREYERIRKSPLPKVLRAHDIGEISQQLIRLRIARKITQEQLANRIGCKQSDISRLEREDYQGYTVNQLEKVAASLDAEIELNLIPRENIIMQKRTEISNEHRRAI